MRHPERSFSGPTACLAGCGGSEDGFAQILQVLRRVGLLLHLLPLGRGLPRLQAEGRQRHHAYRQQPVLRQLFKSSKICRCGAYQAPRSANAPSSILFDKERAQQLHSAATVGNKNQDGTCPGGRSQGNVPSGPQCAFRNFLDLGNLSSETRAERVGQTIRNAKRKKGFKRRHHSSSHSCNTFEASMLVLLPSNTKGNLATLAAAKRSNSDCLHGKSLALVNTLSAFPVHVLPVAAVSPSLRSGKAFFMYTWPARTSHLVCQSVSTWRVKVYATYAAWLVCLCGQSNLTPCQ